MKLIPWTMECKLFFHVGIGIIGFATEVMMPL